MNIEEYIEEDEEPPLLLSPCPSHGKCFHAKSNIRVMISAFFLIYLLSHYCVSLCVCCRCLAVVGLHRCSVGGGMGARVISVLQESSRAR